MVRRRQACIAALSLCWASALACTTASTEVDPNTAVPSDGDGGGVDEAATPGPTPGSGRDDGGCAVRAPRYYAFLKAPSCADVPGAGGVWRVRPAFPEAPASVRDIACAYTWTPEAADATEDVSVLEELEPSHLAKGELVTVACEPPALGADALTDITAEGGAGAPTGVTGCDVCGRVDDGRVYIILPGDDGPDLTVLSVATLGGVWKTFRIARPQSAQLFSVALPPLGGEDGYVGGAVPMFEKPLVGP